MLWLLSGCFLLDQEIATTETVEPPEKLVLPGPAAKAEPKPAPVEPTAEKKPLTCTDAERVRIQCELATGKKLALCEAEGGWSFRYGHPEVELAFPATGYAEDFEVTHEKKGADREVHTIDFAVKDYTYTLTSDRTEGQFDVLFVVKRGEQRLSRAECTTLSGIDLTELPSF